MSLPIIKRFWPKIVPPKRGLKIHVLWGLGGENFWSWSWNPSRKSIPTGTRRFTQKRWRYSWKLFSRAAQEITKNIWTWYFTPLPGAPAGPIVLSFCMLGGTHDIITRTKFEVDRIGGYGATWVQNRGFPMHFWTALTTVLRTTVLHCDVVRQRRITAR